MQTIERPPETQSKIRSRPRWRPFLLIPAVVAFAALLVGAVMSKWAVLLLTIMAALIGLGVWTWNRGFRIIEIVAFLIHFDGVEFSVISIGRISAAVLTLILLHRLFVQRWRPPAVPWKNWLPIWLLFSWATLSGIWANRPGGWFKALLMLYLAFVFFCLTSMMVESHKDIQRFMRAFWVGGLFGSAAGILALFLRTRSEGLIGDPNFFGLVEAAMIPLTVYYYRAASTPRERLMYGVTLAVVLAGAAGAGSRSGLIGAAVAIVATMVSRPGISAGKRARTAGLALVIAPIAFLVGFVMNPANLQRGFSDRGAGRLDFWNVTTDLIAERPILGHGLGQVAQKIPQRLLVTPGVKSFEGVGDAMSSHNTWLDALADGGVIGLALFILSFVMAGWSFLRPRWPYMSDLSSTLFIMLLPVLSSSLFLSLLNNKLAWSLLGLAAALQVKSDESRWSGLTGEGNRSEVDRAPDPLEPYPGPMLTDSPNVGSDLVLYGAPLGRSLVPVRQQELLANPLKVDSMPEVKLARWDLAITRTMLWRVVATAIAVAVCAFVYGSRLPVSYQATVGFMAPQLDSSSAHDSFRIPKDRAQQALALVASEAYAQNLQRLSGINRSIEEIAGQVSVARQRMGGMVEVTFSDHDRRIVEQASPYLIVAINDIYASAREYGSASVNDQARPINPGERNYYTGPPLIAVLTEAEISAVSPKVTWMTLVGGLAGAIFAFGLVLLGSRRPRITSNDDFPARTGTTVWTHISHSPREPADTVVAQVQQLAVTVAEMVPPDRDLRRILVSPAERSAEARVLTVDLAASFVARGERVVLVDGDVDRPWMTLRLNPFGQRPSAGEELDLQTIHRRAMSTQARRLVGGQMDEMRLIRGSQLLRANGRYLDPERLAEFDEGVTIIVLAPPPSSEIGIAGLVEWAQATVIPMRVGRTTTEAAQTAASRVRLLGGSRNGIALING